MANMINFTTRAFLNNCLPDQKKKYGNEEAKLCEFINDSDPKAGKRGQNNLYLLEIGKKWKIRPK